MREYPWITTGAQVFFDKYFADNPSAKVLKYRGYDGYVLEEII